MRSVSGLGKKINQNKHKNFNKKGPSYEQIYIRIE
jgi:hypothetical protein